MTAEKNVRPASARDLPELKALWKTVFGDGDADINHFFRTWFSPACAAVIGERYKPVSAAYALPVGDLVLPGKAPAACAMIYAVATNPEFRGLGYGAAVTREAADLAGKAGCPAVVLKPAEEQLFEFYEKRSGFREFFDVYHYGFSPAGLQTCVRRLTASPASPEEYRALRRSFLDGTVYIDMDARGLAYQQHLCAASGGGLFMLSDSGSPAGCAVIEPDGGTVLIKELLLEDACRLEDAVSAVAGLFPADYYAVRTPCSCGEGAQAARKRRFGMLMRSELEAGALSNTVKWYGLAFD